MRRRFAISIAADVDGTPDQIRDSALMKGWVAEMARGWRVQHFEVKMALIVHGVVLMIFADVRVTNGRDERRNSILIRRHTVEPVIVVRRASDGKEFLVTVRQMRPAVGCYVVSNAAGGIDANELPLTAAQRERNEELGTDKINPPIVWEEPIDLNKHYLGESVPMVVTPGGSNERAWFFLVTATISDEQFALLNAGHKGGLENEAEDTVSCLVPIDDAVRRLPKLGGIVDMKTVLGLAMYQSYLASQP